MSHKHGREGRPRKPPKVRKKVIHVCPSCGGNYEDGRGVRVDVDNRDRGVKGHATFCEESCAYRTILEGRVMAILPPQLIDPITGKPVGLRRPPKGPIMDGPETRLPAGGAPDTPPVSDDEYDDEAVDEELKALREARIERMKEREEGA